MTDEIYPNKCPLFDICKDNLQGTNYSECKSGNKQCTKDKQVIIGLLNDILAELREPGKK